MIHHPGPSFDFVRCGSHRARAKLVRLLGAKPREFYPGFTSGQTKHIFAVPRTFMGAALEIRGVTRARWADHFAPTWSSEDLGMPARGMPLPGEEPKR